MKLELDAGSTLRPPVIETGFECSNPLITWRCISPTRVEVALKDPNHRNFFIFRLHGVAGKTIRVDLKADDGGKPIDNWASMNPVYTYADSLDEKATYESAESATAVNTTAERSFYGSLLPSTEGQKWHFIKEVWQEDQKTMSFVEKFEGDSVYIAMRVPYTAEYNTKSIRELGDNPYVTLYEVGHSSQGKSLLLVKIEEDSGRANSERKPCVLIYGGEHADEFDAMWAVHGAMEFLSGDSAGARHLRSQVTFLIIPMLDPDATTQGQHQGIISSFVLGRRTLESTEYANWFQHWISDGNRLDLVLDLHNVQSLESTNVACALLGGSGSQRDKAIALHNMIIENSKAAGFSAMARPSMWGYSPERLGGWLSRYYGAVTLAYEVNTQAPGHQLNLNQINRVGEIFAESASEFLEKKGGLDFLSEIDNRRRERLGRWTKYSKINVGDAQDAIQSEEAMSQVQAASGGDLLISVQKDNYQ